MTPLTSACGGAARLLLTRRIGASTVRVLLAVDRCRRTCAGRSGHPA
ncbi:hypothetical protein [Streptomyces sp. SID3343]|nr:hypothetical protein [Streptomyces sp. SID3343]MYV97923.1 hypothetical protein [Streptomyces sp. SID3343]